MKQCFGAVHGSSFNTFDGKSPYTSKFNIFRNCFLTIPTLNSFNHLTLLFISIMYLVYQSQVKEMLKAIFSNHLRKSLRV